MFSTRSMATLQTPAATAAAAAAEACHAATIHPIPSTS
jgi:hypothetical protein